jgi:UDP-N-acetylglucosamine 2-epimerase (non-hydrolysing)/GDP/UDP-N,N'-diacetylbacillosamine 2-epimerase (hydrolysing)
VFGRTEDLVDSDGVRVSERLDWAESTDAATQAGVAIEVVARALDRQSPDCLVLAGDRFETAAAAFAATLRRIPIVHLHGGEETEGVIDNALRNAITKLSHLHLVSHQIHANRVVAMGEDPATVHIVGAPGLDSAFRTDLPDHDELSQILGLALVPPVVIVTVHPATLASTDDDAEAVAAAMDAIPGTYIITLPNADPGHEEVRQTLRRAAALPGRTAVEALGDRAYWGLMRVADAMLGNSSSGLIEAPINRLPVVNVGDRQKGRLRGDNVIDTPPEAEQVTVALRRALDPGYRSGLSGISPYGDGKAADRIVSVLESWIPPRPPRKRGVAT